jgi:hypothetical protein
MISSAARSPVSVRPFQITLSVDRSAFTAEMHAVFRLSFDAVFCNVPVREVTRSDRTTAG